MNLEKIDKKLIFFIFKKEFKMMSKSPALYAASLFFLLGSALSFIGSDYWFNTGLSDLKSFFLNMPFLFCVLIPMLTMSLWAEEKKQFTDKFLFSLPIPISFIVIGKYLNLIIVWGLMLILSMIIPFSVLPLIFFDLGSFSISYLSVFLFGAGLLSLSSALSALSYRSELNFLLSFLTVVFFTFVYPLIKNLPLPHIMINIIKQFSFTEHFDSAARGIFDSRDLMFYLLLIFLGIELNIFILKKQRAVK